MSDGGWTSGYEAVCSDVRAAQMRERAQREPAAARFYLTMAECWTTNANTWRRLDSMEQRQREHDRRFRWWKPWTW